MSTRDPVILADLQECDERITDAALAACDNVQVVRPPRRSLHALAFMGPLLLAASLADDVEDGGYSTVVDRQRADLQAQVRRDAEARHAKLQEVKRRKREAAGR